MKPTLGVGTGCFYRLDMQQTEIINLLKDLEKVQAVEITLSDTKELRNTNWNHLANLTEQFKYVSIHAPIKKTFREKEEDIKILERLEKRRKQIEAETVVFHPNTVEKPKILNKVENSAIENMQNKKGFDREDFEKFHQDGLGVVIDTVHAHTWDKYPDEAHYMYENYRSELTQFHISANGKKEEHEPLFKYPAQIKQYKDLLMRSEKPLILESKLENKSQIKKEIEVLSYHLKNQK